jgi:hypothetical protein
MGYSFQVVPYEEFKQFSAELNQLESPIERYQALRVGACCILLAETSKQCLGGITEEKRRLAIWVRNQRSVIRNVRYKGASKMRGALNADISNASDTAKNQLEWIRSASEDALQRSDARMKECLQYISWDEANAYKETFRSELNAKTSAEKAKKILAGLLVCGVITIFLFPILGIILLIAGLFVYLGNRERWTSLKKAELERSMQMAELKISLDEVKEFDAQIDAPIKIVSDDHLTASLAAIGEDLKSRYVYLDIACRELGSTSLSWNELAQELYDESSKEEKGEDDVPTITNNSNPSTDKSAEETTAISSEELIADNLIHKDVDDYYFTIDMALARKIMKTLGYKRMPSEWATISLKAEERISRCLAERVGIDYDDFFWSFDEGNIRAESLN